MTPEETKQILEARVLKMMDGFAAGFIEFREKFPAEISLEDIRFEWTKYKVASLAIFAQEISELLKAQYDIK